MRWLVGLGLFAACAQKPPEPLGPVTNAGQPVIGPIGEGPTRETRAPRPDFDIVGLVPDFHELLRWPLTPMSHPTLEPHFAVAAVFAAPGVSWIDLCQRGAQNRSLAGRYSDELQYLRGWCHVLSHDVDTALGELTPLLHSTVRGMTEAVRIDIANIIVDGGDAEKAEHWLSRHSIDDPETLDTLGASYVEVGKEADAWQINMRLLGMARAASADIKCRRITKQIVLGPEGTRPENIAVLEAATKAKVPDPVCVELFDEVKCWRDPANDCGDFLRDHQLEYRYTNILWLAYRWPKHDASYKMWRSVADHASAGIPLVGAEKALLVALNAAERTQAACTNEMQNVIAATIGNAMTSAETRHALVGFRDRCEESRLEATRRAAAEHALSRRVSPSPARPNSR